MIKEYIHQRPSILKGGVVNSSLGAPIATMFSKESRSPKMNQLKETYNITDEYSQAHQKPRSKKVSESLKNNVISEFQMNL